MKYIFQIITTFLNKLDGTEISFKTKGFGSFIIAVLVVYLSNEHARSFVEYIVVLLLNTILN